uniref:Uncharacterized protein n=1 Tax=Trichuris muris TaxID=70415 RepID=A0A5S6Q7W6_TRIMR
MRPTGIEVARACLGKRLPALRAPGILEEPDASRCTEGNASCNRSGATPDKEALSERDAIQSGTFSKQTRANRVPRQAIANKFDCSSPGAKGSGYHRESNVSGTQRRRRKREGVVNTNSRRPPLTTAKRRCHHRFEQTGDEGNRPTERGQLGKKCVILFRISIPNYGQAHLRPANAAAATPTRLKAEKDRKPTCASPFQSGEGEFTRPPPRGSSLNWGCSMLGATRQQGEASARKAQRKLAADETASTDAALAGLGRLGWGKLGGADPTLGPLGRPCPSRAPFPLGPDSKR